VDQLEVVIIADVAAVDSLAFLLCLVHTLCKCDNLLLILPEEDEREWDSNASTDKSSNTKWIAIF